MCVGDLVQIVSPLTCVKAAPTLKTWAQQREKMDSLQNLREIKSERTHSCGFSVYVRDRDISEET